MTETWLTNGDAESQLVEVAPLGFCLLHNPRIGRTGGGVGFLVHKTFNVSQLKAPLFQNFESIIIQIAFAGSGHLNFATIL